MRIMLGLLLSATVGCANATDRSRSFGTTAEGSTSSNLSGSSNAGSSASSAGNTGTGTAVASGSTGGGTSSGSAPGAGTTGTSTGAGGLDGDAGPCSNETAFPTEFLACNGSGGIQCQCGQVCVDDPIFVGLITANNGDGVCELPCTTNLNCDNGGSICPQVPDGGARCVPNICDAGIGALCWANDGTIDGGPGTCVIQSERALSLCLPDGVATDSCDQVQYGLTNDDPQAGVLQFQLFPEPAGQRSLYCGAGLACLGNDFRTRRAVDKCLQLCSTSAHGCPPGDACLAQDSRDTSWGFCQPCPPVDQADLSFCFIGSDCCAPTACSLNECCNGRAGFDGASCHDDAECCGHCDAGTCGP